mgnify:CR=1 FL=1
MELTTSQKSAFISEMLSSESGINELIRVLLNTFSKQERSLFVQEHKGEQCNGFRPRRWRGYGCSFELRIPRTRSGSFEPLILGILSHQESERALLLHELYTRGLSCEDIGAVCERLYGHHYSKQQVSFLSNTSKAEIYKWLERQLSPHYLAVYIDATFAFTRREDSVSKEAYYTMLGVLPNGTREVLGVVNHPSEGALNWKNELIALRERGVEQIDLIVSDALTGIETAVAEAFPSAEHQFCITHLKRSMSVCVASKDKGELLRDLEEIFPIEQKGYSMIGQFEKFRIFVARWSRRYPSFRRFDAPRNVAYFSYLNYPPQFHRMIYTTNWIERLNRFYKRTLKMRGALPSAEAVLFLMGRVAWEKTQTSYARSLPLFKDWDALRVFQKNNI